jgi:hypothetical protein
VACTAAAADAPAFLQLQKLIDASADHALLVALRRVVSSLVEHDVEHVRRHLVLLSRSKSRPLVMLEVNKPINLQQQSGAVSSSSQQQSAAAAAAAAAYMQQRVRPFLLTCTPNTRCTV